MHTAPRRLRSVFLRHSLRALVALLALQVLGVLHRGLSFPFRSLLDFGTKLGIVLLFSLPFVLVLASLYGATWAFVYSRFYGRKRKTI